MKKFDNEKGMTLVEVLAVIVLIALIMGVVAKGVIGKGDAAKAKLNEVKMEKVKSSLAQFRLEYNIYPSRLENLVTAGPEVKDSGKPFIATADPDDLKDIWGFPLLYKMENDGRSYSLTTLGSDGVEGGEGSKQDVTVRP